MIYTQACLKTKYLTEVFIVPYVYSNSVPHEYTDNIEGGILLQRTLRRQKRIEWKICSV